MHIFPGLGLKPSHSSDNSESLTARLQGTPGFLCILNINDPKASRKCHYIVFVPLRQQNSAKYLREIST